ncbi:hypothetical protein ACP4OV_019714 [Aristida adscensionis]
MAGTGGAAMEASFWCDACSRLRRPGAHGEPVTACSRCGAAAAALEAIVEVVDARAFIEACHPEAGLRATAAAAPLPTVTVAVGDDCAVCLERLAPGASAAVTPCEHAYHPQCIAPWLEARGTCPLCRAHVAGGGKADRDGLVLCRFDGGRFGLGRRVAGRVHGLRFLDKDGKIERSRVAGVFKGAHLDARMAVRALRRV